MKNNKIMRALCFILIIYTFLSQSAVLVAAVSETVVCPTDDNEQSYEKFVPTLADDVRVGSRLWELFFGEEKKNDEAITLLAGGEVFGVKIRQKYVTIAESRGVPALRPGDVILSIDGKEVKSASDVKRMVENSAGNSLTIRALHLGNEVAVEIRPSVENGEYKLGLTLRDGAAGLGTVTFIDPRTGIFGGLGHGICDSDSGEVISMETGDKIFISKEFSHEIPVLNFKISSSIPSSF